MSGKDGRSFRLKTLVSAALNEKVLINFFRVLSIDRLEYNARGLIYFELTEREQIVLDSSRSF